MFGRLSRLHLKRDFDRVFKKGRKIFHPLLGLRFVKTNLPTSRVVIVVGKKVSKSAVKRNRVRRRLREVIRVRLDQFTESSDLIFIAKTDALKATFTELESAVDRVLHQAKLL